MTNRTAIHACETCSTHHCRNSAAGFIVTPSDDSVPGIYCRACGERVVAEYREKLDPGWRFEEGANA